MEKDEDEGELPQLEVKKRKLSKLLLARVASEKAIDDKLDWHFEQGDEYHCISQGDVDSLSYLRFCLKQQHIKYCMISTWVIAEPDVQELDDWLTRGFIDKLDVWVGEIFSKQHCISAIGGGFEASRREDLRLPKSQQSHGWIWRQIWFCNRKQRKCEHKSANGANNCNGKH